MSPASPRLAPLAPEQWDEPTRTQLRGHVKRIDQYLSGAPGAPRMPNVLGVLGHHARLAGAWLNYNGVLLDDPTLEPCHRELMILRVAWRTGSVYEWVQHARIAARLGVTAEQIEALADTGPGGDGWAGTGPWTHLEALLLHAADQLIDRCAIGDATWAALETHLDARQLLEVPFVVGSYLCLAMVFNSVGLELDPDMRAEMPTRLPESEE
ncbi:carboxymuconolactone decarboxylase family protein [Actinomadura barringtoniae]|uniref:Carboxymuconolactone decarboxylase family protein n=1 Tax=Actinomadura barringtoniae TaxID=1427535 RepID=A0A939P870_9ACTN|nr:carboxymuconolactone decarboxylase family protein [Actinomadura barringtoniae]MBO2447702.1 carboxymuconolactone decarboxylase family protein [Actinomadura barringtoniae]